MKKYRTPFRRASSRQNQSKFLSDTALFFGGRRANDRCDGHSDHLLQRVPYVEYYLTTFILYLFSARDTSPPPTPDARATARHSDHLLQRVPYVE
jgi:hypothetical protein